jgi:PEP-CTERM motif
VNTVRLSAALAALTLTASTACAAVIDLSNGLGPSGGYTSQAYYQVVLGGQPMTAAQQAYSNQEDQLRDMGFLSEWGGNIALGQIFYHIAYGLAAPPPPSTLDLASGGSDLPPPFVTPGGLVAGASDAGATGSVEADVDDGAVLTDVASVGAGLTLTGVTIAVPEPSTWAMLLLGFAGLGLMGWRASPKAAA